MLLGEFIFPVGPKRNQCFVFGASASWHSTELTTTRYVVETALYYTEMRDAMFQCNPHWDWNTQ